MRSALSCDVRFHHESVLTIPSGEVRRHDMSSAKLRERSQQVLHPVALAFRFSLVAHLEKSGQRCKDKTAFVFRRQEIETR
jgi:hypothetical protein